MDRNDHTDAEGDLDGDGLTNLQEFLLGTNAASMDTDRDGLSDLEELDSTSFTIAALPASTTEAVQVLSPLAR